MRQNEHMRALKFGTLAMLMAGATGCVVPQTRHEEVKSALAVEQEAHRRTGLHMYQIEQKLAQVNAELAEREKQLQDQQQTIAQTELQSSVAVKEREAATEMVDQLRGELARVGDHLRAFSEQKHELGTALEEARAQATQLSRLERETSRLTAAVRDLSVLFANPIGVGDFSLELVDGRPSLSVPLDQLFAGEPAAVHADGTRVLANLTRIVRLYDARLAISEQGGEAGSEDSVARLQELSEKLQAQGVEPDRITLDMPPASDDPTTSEPPAERRFAFQIGLSAP